jgi:hypothetical protein
VAFKTRFSVMCANGNRIVQPGHGASEPFINCGISNDNFGPWHEASRYFDVVENRFNLKAGLDNYLAQNVDLTPRPIQNQRRSGHRIDLRRKHYSHVTQRRVENKL